MTDPILDTLKTIAENGLANDRALLTVISQLVDRVLELETRLTKVETELAYAANRKD